MVHDAPGGLVASALVLLVLVSWQQLTNAISLQDVVDLCAYNPAKLVVAVARGDARPFSRFFDDGSG